MARECRHLWHLWHLWPRRKGWGGCAVSWVAPCGGGRVPGCAPGGAVTFCATESHKRTLSLLSATPSLREGATCAGAFAGCAAELTSRLRRCVRTTAASQLTKLARTCAPATPQTPRRRRNHKGLDSRNSHTGHRCARPRLVSSRPKKHSGSFVIGSHSGRLFLSIFGTGVVVRP